MTGASGAPPAADRGTCPGCGLDRSHDVLAECWAALEEHDSPETRWRGAPDDIALVAPDLPTERALRWLRADGYGVWPLVGSPPDCATVSDLETDGYYARADAVEQLRRRFHRGPIADAAVVERLAAVDGWLAVRRSCRQGTLVPRGSLGSRPDPEVRAFELTDPPSGRDPAALASDRFLLQRVGEAFGDVLFAHDGWEGERVALAPDPGDVPAGVGRRLRAEMAAELL